MSAEVAFVLGALVGLGITALVMISAALSEHPE